jgi:mRNA-degrading endonuclease RelE of RelBE toxin-antitoxin system
MMLRAFDRGRITSAVDQLSNLAETETRGRKRLRAGFDVPADYPDPTWEIRVGAYRVFYAVEGVIVTVLAVRLKGRKATGEIL